MFYREFSSQHLANGLKKVIILFKCMRIRIIASWIDMVSSWYEIARIRRNSKYAWMLCNCDFSFKHSWLVSISSVIQSRESWKNAVTPVPTSLQEVQLSDEELMHFTVWNVRRTYFHIQSKIISWSFSYKNEHNRPYSCAIKLKIQAYRLV